MEMGVRTVAGSSSRSILAIVNSFSIKLSALMVVIVVLLMFGLGEQQPQRHGPCTATCWPSASDEKHEDQHTRVRFSICHPSNRVSSFEEIYYSILFNFHTYCSSATRRMSNLPCMCPLHIAAPALIAC